MPTGDSWRAELFRDWHQSETIAPPSMVVDVTKSITNKIVCESGIEKNFALFLEGRPDVPLFIKVAALVQDRHPLHGYNPDWAFVREHPRASTSTSSARPRAPTKLEELQWGVRRLEDQVGTAHFEALKVDYFWGNDPKVLIEVSPDFAMHEVV